MQTEIRRSLFGPLQYWRTLFLVSIVGVTSNVIFNDALVVMFSTLPSAFAFSAYERRRWIVMPTQLQAGDVVLRLALAFGVTYVLCVSRLS